MLSYIQWCKTACTFNDKGAFRLNFPISFTKYKNAPLCLHIGAASAMFGMASDHNISGNLEDLTGSYLYLSNLNNKYESGWHIAAFISGC